MGRIACIRCLANDAGFAWHNYIMDQTEKGTHYVQTAGKRVLRLLVCTGLSGSP